MQITDLHKLLIRHEGLRLKVYKDTAGFNTIGVGRNLDSVGISVEEAMSLLDSDIVRATASATNVVKNFSSLCEARQDALVDMAFNLGCGGIMKFKEMIACIDSGDFDGASKEMLKSQWAIQVGERANELSFMMREGKYP